MLIKNRIARIEKVFNTNEILTQKPTLSTIQKYYSTNKLAYSVLHSRENFIHLGLSNGEKFKKSDLKEPVKFIGKYIKNTKNFRVLELGTGRGANSGYLAQEFPNTSFIGIDITKEQLDFAKKIVKRYKNYNTIQQDFHDLAMFKRESFNIVFVIESLCHSENKERVLKEVCRVLKKDGKFIIIDGYLNKELRSFSSLQKKAFKLTEIGMAIKGSITYDKFSGMAKKNKYAVEYEENVSLNVIPSMKRLENYSRAFFKFELLAKLLAKMLPKEILLNAITAYLWVPLTKQKVVGYYITVLKKTG